MMRTERFLVNAKRAFEERDRSFRLVDNQQHKTKPHQVVCDETMNTTVLAGKRILIKDQNALTAYVVE